MGNRISIFLLLMLLLGPFWLPLVEKRELAYKAAPNRFGNFHFIAQEIFHPKEQPAIVFIGSSSMWTAFDPIVLQRQLTQSFATEMPVKVFAHNWRSEETIYFMLDDLERSKLPPKLVVASYPEGGGTQPHPVAGYLFSPWLHGSTWLHLSLSNRISVYFTAVATVPRRVVNLFLPFPDVVRGRNARVFKDQGSILSPRGFLKSGERRKKYMPESFVKSDLMLSPDWVLPHNKFERNPNVSKKLIPIDPFEAVFIKAATTVDLPLAYVYLPSSEDKLDEIIFRTNASFMNCIPYIAAPLKIVFPDKDRDVIRDAYYNANHNNAVGASYRSHIYQGIFSKLLNSSITKCGE